MLAYEMEVTNCDIPQYVYLFVYTKVIWYNQNEDRDTLGQIKK